MFLYIAIFLFVVINYLTNIDNQRNSKKLWAVYILGLGVFVGLGDMLGGYDRYIYGNLFDQLADVRAAGGNVLASQVFMLYHNEPLYGILNVLISFLTSNRYIFIFVITLIVYINLFFAITRYCDNYAIAVVLFMGLMFFFTFTYLRQMLAASFVWWAYKYLIERNPVRYFAVVVFAALIHNSALIMLPIYFVPNVKYNKGAVLILLLLCFVLGAVGVSNMLYGGYGDYIDELRAESMINEEGGLRWAYLLESVVFSALIFMNYDKIDERDTTQVGMLNLALLFCAVLLLFIRSENGGRISWMFTMGLIATLCHMSVYEKRLTIMPLICLVLSSGLFFRILRGWGENGYQILYPYKTFLTDGVRNPDNCHEEYEYDNNYDDDKFYR